MKSTTTSIIINKETKQTTTNNEKPSQFQNLNRKDWAGITEPGTAPPSAGVREAYLSLDLEAGFIFEERADI